MSAIFPPPNLSVDNSTRGGLTARRAALLAKVQAVPDARIMRPELDTHLADDLVEDFTFEALTLGEPFTEEKGEQTRVSDTDPRYLGPTGAARSRNVEVFVVTVPLVRGSAAWLSHRPEGSFQLMHERTVYDSGRRGIVIRVIDDRRGDPDGSRAQSFVQTELYNVRRYVDATNDHLADWNAKLPGLCAELISTERQKRLEIESRKRLLGPPVVASDATPVPHFLPRRRRPRAQVDPIEVKRLGGRMYLTTQDFTAALVEMQRSAQFIADHPAIYQLDESGMRDHVLFALNSAFPAGGTGETFSKKGKTDIRVVTAVAAATGFGDCVFKAECKVWDGPASAAEALDQLCERYLTAAELRASIVLFTRPPYERGEVTRQALARLINDFSAERVGDVAGWPVVRVRHPALPYAIEVAVVAM